MHHCKILSRDVRDNVASLLGSAGHRSAGHSELASGLRCVKRRVVIAPDAVDAVHGTPCRVADVPFLSGQQVTDQRALSSSLQSAYRLKWPAGPRSAGQIDVIFQSHQLESA